MGEQFRVTPREVPQEISLSKIQENPQNPRKYFDKTEIRELADNINAVGLLQPIRVRSVDGRFQIVHGHRRYRAVKMLERETIPATVATMSDQEAFEVSLSENILRADLSAIEEAEGFQRLIDEFDYTQQQVAETFGKSQPSIAARLVLLKLPESVQDKIIRRLINQSHGELLAKIDDPELQIKLADEVERDGLSVRELERRIKDLTPEQSAEQPEPSTQDAMGESGEQAEPSESDAQVPDEQPQVTEAEATSDEIEQVEKAEPDAVEAQTGEPQFYCDERFVSLDRIKEHIGKPVRVVASAGKGGANSEHRGTILGTIERDGEFILELETETGLKRQISTGTTTGKPTDIGILGVDDITEIQVDETPRRPTDNGVLKAPPEVVIDKDENIKHDTFDEYYNWIMKYSFDLVSENIESAKEVCVILTDFVEQLKRKLSES